VNCIPGLVIPNSLHSTLPTTTVPITGAPGAVGAIGPVVGVVDTSGPVVGAVGAPGPVVQCFFNNLINSIYYLFVYL